MTKFLICLAAAGVLLVLSLSGSISSTAQIAAGNATTGPIPVVQQSPKAGESQSLTDLSSGSTTKANETEDNSLLLSSMDLNMAAFKNMGDLAFVWQGLLYVLDGKTGGLKQLTSSGQARHPVWSHDGEWIAFISEDSPAGDSGQVWLVHRDGKEARQVQGQNFSWSPTSDVLAVSETDGLWLVPVKGTPHLEVKGSVSLPCWSPDGKSIAYTVTLPFDPQNPENRSDALYTLNLSTGQAVKRLTAPGAGIEIATWRPNGEGLLYWVDPLHSASLAADGMPLWSYRLGDAESTEPTLLSIGLAYPDWQVFSPQGQLLMVSGGGRTVWSGKNLIVIDPGLGKNQKLPNPNGLVATDPSFSPDGSKIACVAAQELDGVWGFSDLEKLTNWIATRALWIENADGSNAHPLKSAGRGVYQPVWSKDGGKIMYVRDNSLWIIEVNGGNPEKILGPFPGWEKDKFGYYGYIRHDDFAWFEPFHQ